MSYKREIRIIISTIITILIIVFAKHPDTLKTIMYVLIGLLVTIVCDFIILAVKPNRFSEDSVVNQCPKCGMNTITIG